MKSDLNEIVLKSDTRVPPIEVSLSEKPNIQWINNDKEDMIVFFPNWKLFGDIFYKIIKEGEALSLEVEYELPEGEESRTFNYAVFSAHDDDFLTGSSSPVIIVRR